MVNFNSHWLVDDLCFLIPKNFLINLVIKSYVKFCKTFLKKYEVETVLFTT